MASEAMNSSLFEAADASTKSELLVSAVLHLMSHYTVRTDDTGGCTKLASVIERHLKALADLPDLAPVLRATCRQLSQQWAKVVECTMQPQDRRSRLIRLVTGPRLD